MYQNAQLPIMSFVALYIPVQLLMMHKGLSHHFSSVFSFVPNEEDDITQKINDMYMLGSMHGIAA